jgi:hypothetical protein
MAEKKVARKSTNKPKVAQPTLKGAKNVAPKKTPTSRKPSAPKPVVFSVATGGGIWMKLRQSNVVVFDEEKGYNRELRFCPAEKSIFKEEQSDTAIREQIVFVEGSLTVQHTNPSLLAYLRLHPDNTANGGSLFNEVNTEVDAAKELENEFALHDAIAVIKTSEIETLIPIALSYGISADMSSIEIKRALLQQAKANPASFMGLVDSPAVRLKADIITAIDFQILRETEDGMYWHDSNTLIMPTPLGKNTTDVFTRFLMTDKGNPVRDELERQLGEL